MNCKLCGIAFNRSPSYLELQARIAPHIPGEGMVSFPLSLYCPTCNAKKKLSFSNVRNLEKNVCAATGKDVLSTFGPEKNVPVYQSAYWWSDAYDPHAYAQEYDPSRVFSEQFAELYRRVPKQNLALKGCENCDYNNLLSFSKNCYLAFSGRNNIDSAYAYASIKLQNSYDIWWCASIQLSYDIFCCDNLFECRHCYNTDNASNCILCSRCNDIRDCIGCYGLQHKRFCVFNEQLSEEAYRTFLQGLNLGSRSEMSALQRRFWNFVATLPQQAQISFRSDDCTGELLTECVACEDCYGAAQCGNCHHLIESAYNKDCIESVSTYNATGLLYQAYHCTEGCYNCAFVFECHGCSDTFYSFDCYNCRECFGCVGLKRAEYCIFNKPYSKADYYAQLSSIIEAMRASGEWGEWISPRYSIFGYNETVAQQFFPSFESDARAHGFRWTQPKVLSRELVPINAADLPDCIEQVNDSILGSVIKSSCSNKLFKITSRELAFYRQYRIPLPVAHPDERNDERARHRRDFKLYPHTCHSCGRSIASSLDPSQGLVVYCTPCYTKWTRLI